MHQKYAAYPVLNQSSLKRDAAYPERERDFEKSTH